MTVFIRALDSADKQEVVMRAVARGAIDASVYTAQPQEFRLVPRSPFAYWVGPTTRRLFAVLPALEHSGRTAKIGMSTSDDTRFLRLNWEVDPQWIGRRWVGYAKGGSYAQFYSDIYLLVGWADDGEELKSWVVANPSDPRTTHWSRRVANSEYFGRPGLTWSLRSQKGFAARALPGGNKFAHKGPTVFVNDDSRRGLSSTLAVMLSSAFSFLLGLQMAFGSYEVGAVQRTPIPDMSTEDESALAELADRAWSIRHSLDTSVETSHAFVLPALLQVRGDTLAVRTANWSDCVHKAEAELKRIETEIDARCFDLYGISEEDRKTIREGFGVVAADEVESPEDIEDESAEALDAVAQAAGLISWAVGVALGRFDIRVAARTRDLPIEPNPFKVLPVCSAGRLTGGDGLPLIAPPVGYPIAFPGDGVLVDDTGHPKDLYAAIEGVLEVVFCERADAVLSEVACLLDPKKADLRAWLSRNYFQLHLKRHSRSRRKAPIIWQLSTTSASYSLWLYAHRVDSDSLFRLRADVVDPKLAVEERRLASLVQEAGLTATMGQARLIAAQQDLVGELRAMREEIARVAPLWSPDLDDGVAIAMSPLWRLVPQHRAWQKELRTTFEALAAGKYDWAHLAMHLWPERVVPKCATDRSLAIAHDLTDVFWAKSSDDKWSARTVGQDTIDKLIAERTSPAVADALRGLLEAPVASGGRGRTRKAGEKS